MSRRAKDPAKAPPQRSNPPAARRPPSDLTERDWIAAAVDLLRCKIAQDAIPPLDAPAAEQEAAGGVSPPVTPPPASNDALQSLNEGLTTRNDQLHDALERQRAISNDLQNILYSTDVAVLFLDTKLNIRFFTPATRALFSIIPSDIGRPLADLNSLSADGGLLPDARAVLQTLTPIEREIEAQSGAWYIRRILPYRTQEGGVDGVVITITDVSDRKRVADALETAQRQAQMATVAKSRFLAAASHDLRQPLQTLTLLQGLLAKSAEGPRAQKLVARLDETLGAMSGMLNTLLDITHIESGTIQTEVVAFPINDLIGRLKEEFTYHAQAQRLTLHVVPCRLMVESDPSLLEQMLRNIVSNAFKYTKKGRVLIGCRRRKGLLSVEVWDTGIGIPEGDLQEIFKAYHQVDNPARQRSRGLGLGLSIVQSLAKLLHHPVRVSSRFGKGSVFAIDLKLASGADILPKHASRPIKSGSVDERRTGTILVVEDDPEVRDLLDIHLNDEGYRAVTAPDGRAALALVGGGALDPDLVLADFNLPNGMNGLELAEKLRKKLGRQIPVIVLTGDISTDTSRNVSLHKCVQLNKPVKLKELALTIQRLLPSAPLKSPPTAPPRPPLPDVARPRAKPTSGAVTFVVDDDDHLRAVLKEVLENAGRVVQDYASCEAFLESYRPGQEACLLVDAYLPGMTGLELLQRLSAQGDKLPAIMITGNSDVAMAVQAMKAGALDFIEKPVTHADLLASVERALERSRDTGKLLAWREEAANHVAGLTSRQRQIMEMVLAGQPSKNIAADLGISQRTVENHRAMIMKRTGSKSLPALARLALAAGGSAPDEADQGLERKK